MNRGLRQERDSSLAIHIWHKQFFSRDLFPILYQSGIEHQISRHREPSSPELLRRDTRRHLPSGSPDALVHLWRVQCNYFNISRACRAFPAVPSSETKQQRSDLQSHFHTTAISWDLHKLVAAEQNPRVFSSFLLNVLDIRGRTTRNRATSHNRCLKLLKMYRVLFKNTSKY